MLKQEKRNRLLHTHVKRIAIWEWRKQKQETYRMRTSTYSSRFSKMGCENLNVIDAYLCRLSRYIQARIILTYLACVSFLAFITGNVGNQGTFQLHYWLPEHKTLWLCPCSSTFVIFCCCEHPWLLCYEIIRSPRWAAMWQNSSLLLY